LPEKEENMEHPHAKSIEGVVDTFNTDTEQGLSASAAKKRLEEHGPNQLEEQQQKSLFLLFVEQFNTPVAYLLFVAAGLSFAFGDFAEGIAIVIVLLVNAIIGFSMEYQARKSMQALQDMDKVHAHVLRDGEPRQIDAEEVVPGDVLILEPGDMVSADARLFQVSEIQINESALTGESVPVDKHTEPMEEDTPTADKRNMAFKGTAVTRGKARGIVTGTGMKTELGNISAMVSSAEEHKTPINKKLNSLTKKLIYLVLGMAALLGISSTVTGKDTYTIIQTSIAWAIAAIPEGLPIVASIALARGMLRLAKKEVIVKRLEAVETLGETNVILTDKTGTLTENRLNVAHLSWPETDIDLNKEGVSQEQRDNTFFRHLWKIGVQCNNADYDPEKGEEEAGGDPLEIAILRWSHTLDGEQTQAWIAAERAAEDPFDSESAMMGMVTKEEDGYYTSAKGAASSILEQCTRLLTDTGEEAMSSEDREHWQKHDDELSNDGLRCLAFAYRKTDEPPEGADEEDFLHDLVFVGLVGFIDPPQEDVKQAIEESKEAGIRVVMVTGDHPGTAQNVARQVNITSHEQTKVMQGKDLPDEVSESEAEELVKTDIFSRVDPAQKYQIIDIFQKAGYIVGMTGDGVNDAPALKKADIGIAMGLRGTEVAKEVAAMTLKNDHFPSILKAIREGRIIFGNIRKFIVYQLSYHLSEVLVIAAVSFLFFELVLLPLQLLFLNILTDVFPALALGVGEGRQGIMKQPPKDPEEPILDRSSWRRIVVYGAVLSLFVFAAFHFVRWQWDAEFALANNVAFFTLAFAQLFHVLDMRDNDEPIFNNQVTRNKYVWMALAFCTAAILAAYFIPGLSSLLSLPAMPLAYWGVVATAAVGAILSIQVVKSVFKSL
jgi:Ca2+-transporting ATPase